MGLLTAFADAVHKKRRGRHILKKVGFRETHRDKTFQDYRRDRDSWQKAGAEEAFEV